MGKKNKFKPPPAKELAESMAKKAEEQHDATFSTFAQSLAHNKLSVRNNTLKVLRSFFELKEEGHTSEDMMKIWKGLFYTFWMSDKPLIQEELATKLADLIHCFKTIDGAMNYLAAFYATMTREWSLLDRLRVDKYYFLLRTMEKQSLTLLAKLNWQKMAISAYSEVLIRYPLNVRGIAYGGLSSSVVDHFLPLLTEVCDETKCYPRPVQFQTLLVPFVEYFATHNNNLWSGRTLDNVLHVVSSNGFPEVKPTTKESKKNRLAREQRDLKRHAALGELFGSIAASRDIEMHGRRRATLYKLQKQIQKQLGDVDAFDEDESEVEEDFEDEEYEAAIQEFMKEDDFVEDEFDEEDDEEEEEEEEEDFDLKKKSKKRPLIARADSDITIDMTPRKQKRGNQQQQQQQQQSNKKKNNTKKNENLQNQSPNKKRSAAMANLNVTPITKNTKKARLSPPSTGPLSRKQQRKLRQKEQEVAEKGAKKQQQQQQQQQSKKSKQQQTPASSAETTPIKIRADDEIVVNMTPRNTKRKKGVMTEKPERHRSVLPSTPPNNNGEKSKLQRRVSWGSHLEVKFQGTEPPSSVKKKSVKKHALRGKRNPYYH